ncbi:MAG: L-threonylcarbamoyladenylate synthase [Deltaproteobacteria bacterium]
MKTQLRKISPLAIETDVIREAAALLERGGLVVFPTETVYGIAVNLLHKGAFERLRQFKERSEAKQFSIHLASPADVSKYAVDVLPRAYKLMHRFWPGPLTLVLKAPGGRSVGLRLPAHPVALRLLAAVDFPVIAPSANRAGHAEPRDAATALQDCDGYVDMVLDAGPAEWGKASTVVDARALPFTVLREGALAAGDIRRISGRKTVLFVCTGNSCRSVMAEYLLKKRLKEWGRDDIDVLSAGTGAFAGSRASQETEDLLKDADMDASGHRSRRLTAALIEEADLILGMETRHREEALRLLPQAKDRTHVLGAFTGLSGLEAEVGDPIGGSAEVYHVCFLKLQQAVAKLKDRI